MKCFKKTESGETSTHDMALRSISRLAGSSNATSFITNAITASASRRNTVICQLGLSGNIIGGGTYLSGALASSPRWRAGGCRQHPARDGDCEKIRAGIPAAARRVSVEFEAERDSVSRSGVASTDGGVG